MPHALVTSPNEKVKRFIWEWASGWEGLNRETGYKMGKWLDVSCFVRRI